MTDEDLIELAEFLGSLHDWMRTDHDTLSRSVHQYTFELLTLDELIDDTINFAYRADPTTNIPIQ
ncbi:MAG: hypothetical protein ACK5O2_13135 [Microthrixaceae bacterium]